MVLAEETKGKPYRDPEFETIQKGYDGVFYKIPAEWR